MRVPRRVHLGALGTALVLTSLASAELNSQERPAGASLRDTTLPANTRFEAGGLHRFFMGDNYRDEWSTPITVPFLDLRSFAGGLRAVKTGGGRQTLNLRFETSNGTEYVFRPVNKGLILPDEYHNTVIWDLIADARSALHPTAPLVASPILGAAGVLRPTPTLFVMPDDASLGKFREQFAGKLGTIEEVPGTPEKAPGFAGALKIIESEELLERINRDPAERVDTRGFLTARLVDMLVNDNDRHPGQWEWARLSQAAEAPWVPIARDRDKVTHSVEGFLPKLARVAKPSIITFDAGYASVKGLIAGALDLDRRLLVGLEKPVWDSVAASLTRRISDSVIERAVYRLPKEYSPSFAEISGKLKARRDSLPTLAAGYYEVIAKVADIHGTDGDEWATVLRSEDGSVDVGIQSGNRAPHFRRRFVAGQTSEIRLYLHGGNDVAIVRGTVAHSIPVRIIGGQGTNTLLDSSRVGGRTGPTHLYDAGTVRGARYDGDSADKREIDVANLPLDRRPWAPAYGELAPAQKDYGTQLRPLASIGSGHGLGLVTRIGIARYTYGFRRVPYTTMTMVDAAYATAISGFDTGLGYDRRLESSSVHIPVSARMSQLEVVEFRGLGNDVPEIDGAFDDVRQRQWSFRPALGLSPNSRSDISVGPIIRYTSTDSTANRFISQQRPYGFSSFGQAGLQLKAHYDTRRDELPDLGGGTEVLKLEKNYPRVWGKVDFAASAYPGVMDAQTAYQKVAGAVTGYLTAPVFTRPVLALRAGGEKLFGDFPYFDAAFIGGSRSLRTEHRQRFAGDASLYGTTELRVPIANFPFILPLDVGAIGFVDVARVYVNGESPGGWHQGSGAGFWIGLVSRDISMTFTRTNNPDRRTLTNIGFVF